AGRRRAGVLAPRARILAAVLARAVLGVRRRTVGLPGGLPGVVRHVPARALELDGGGGEQLLDALPAGGAFGQGRIRELLDPLEPSALRALVLVERHSLKTPNSKNSTHDPAGQRRVPGAMGDASALRPSCGRGARPRPAAPRGRAPPPSLS